MVEPTTALTYGDLILVVAEQLGVAYYGAAGDEAAQSPVDVYTLDKCKRYVQDGIRMFMADSPPNGWRWQRPLISVDIWQDLGISMPTNTQGSNVATAVYAGGVTTVTATSDSFSAAMADQVIAVKGHGVFTIDAYVSATEVTLTSGTDYSWSGSKAFAVSDPTDADTATATYSAITELTTVTAAAGTFFSSTENSVMYVTDEDGGVTLATYSSDTVMTAAGDVSWVGSKTFSLPSNGIYMMPQNFAGEAIGEPTYVAGSNLGVPISWIHELEIRRMRENGNGASGNPYYAAIRRDASSSRRWNLMVYPNSGGTYQVEFPCLIYFDAITETTAVHPAGFAHDEAVKAASLAQAELQGEDVLSNRMQYYRDIMLPNSWKIDARSAPRNLGYCGNPGSVRLPLRDLRQYYRRPNVSFR